MVGSKTKFICTLLIILTALTLSGCRDIRGRLEDYLDAAHRLWGFDGTVLIAYRDHVILARGYGMANQQFQIHNTVDTKFFIGSITKQFTAAAILILKQRGLIDLDKPISTYLPDYPRPAGDKITIRQLLTHTSGVPNYTDWPGVFLRRTSPISPTELMDLFKDKPLEFEPGTQFHYSNSGYIILGAIIEKVSGQSYEAFLHHEILKPLGMNSSGYGRREAAHPGRAEGYTEESGILVDATPIDFSVLHTAGALYSTVGDMNLWNRALYTDKILTRESIREMFTPGPNGYGFGWFIDNNWGKWHGFHGGFLDGFYTFVDRWFKDQVFIVVFSNEDEAPVRKIARGLAAIIFGEEYDFPISKTPANLTGFDPKEYEGTFEMSPDVYRFVYNIGDSVYTNIQFYQRYLIYPQAIDTFYFALDNTHMLIFSRDSLGHIDGCMERDDDRLVVARKLFGEKARLFDLDRKAISLDSAKYNEYQGTYKISSETGEPKLDMIIKVRHKGTRLVASFGDFRDVVLFPAAIDRFFHEKSTFELDFIRDENGAVDGCIIKMGGYILPGTRIE